MKSEHLFLLFGQSLEQNCNKDRFNSSFFPLFLINLPPSHTTHPPPLWLLNSLSSLFYSRIFTGSYMPYFSMKSFLYTLCLLSLSLSLSIFYYSFSFSLTNYIAFSFFFTFSYLLPHHHHQYKLWFFFLTILPLLHSGQRNQLKQ